MCINFAMLLKWFFVIFAYSQGFADALQLELFVKPAAKSVNKDLINITNLIAEKIFMKHFPVTNIISTVENPKDRYFINFCTLLLRANNGFIIYRLDTHTNIQQIGNRTKTNNIFLIDSYESFKILYKNLDPKRFDFRGYYLFVLINGPMNELGKIFEAMWHKRILNTYAVHADKKDFIYIKTIFPFRKGLCGNTSPILIERLKNGKYFGNWDYFLPDKTKNLFECGLRLVLFERCPAVCITANVKANTSTVTGFEIILFRLIASKLNFKIQRTILPGTKQWGTIYDNGTGTGAILKVLKNESEIAIGNYGLRQNRLEYIDNSIVYHSTPIVFAIPPGDLYSGFEKLIQPFEWLVWALIFLTLFVGILVIVIITWKFEKCVSFVFGTKTGNPIINMLIAIFAQTQPKLPRRNFSRFFLMSFLLFCLIQRSVYQGKLYIFLQSDGRHKEVQTLSEMLIEKNFSVYMQETSVEVIQNFSALYKKYVRYSKHSPAC